MRGVAFWLIGSETASDELDEQPVSSNIDVTTPAHVTLAASLLTAQVCLCASLSGPTAMPLTSRGRADERSTVKGTA